MINKNLIVNIEGRWSRAHTDRNFINDIFDSMNRLENKIGIMPNKLIISNNTYMQLKRKYLTLIDGRVFNTDLIKEIFDLDEVVIVSKYDDYHLKETEVDFHLSEVLTDVPMESKKLDELEKELDEINKKIDFNKGFAVLYYKKTTLEKSYSYNWMGREKITMTSCPDYEHCSYKFILFLDTINTNSNYLKRR